MAAPDRLADTDVTAGSAVDRADDVLAPLLRAPWRFDFFAALRLIDAAFPERARLGEGRRATDEPVRLCQPPFVRFPPTQITGIEYGAARPRILTYVFGLFGPQGPLPLHVTVRALARQKHQHDSTLVSFLDVFHHRMIAFFYRAWAKARPTVEYDRHDKQDRFARRLGALAGSPTDAFLRRSPLPDRFILYTAGFFAMQTRMPEALERLIGLFFNVPVRIQEFVGSWLDIPLEGRTRLACANGASKLGVETVVGARVYSRQYRFRVVLGPIRLASFERFLPGGQRLATLVALVRRTAGLDLDWDVQLVLRREEVPALRLDGKARLGWTSWLATPERSQDAGDLVLNGDVTREPLQV
jgi:type VI secretion system protein ImpH